jgi:uncharacterized protein YsxB (DUF464 family)
MSSNISELNKKSNFVGSYAWKGHSYGHSAISALDLNNVNWIGAEVSIIPSGTALDYLVLKSFNEDDIEIPESTTSLNTTINLLRSIVEPLKDEIKLLKEQNKTLIEGTKSIKKEINLNKLDKFSNYKNNWNGYNAKKFKPSLIQKVSKIILGDELFVQPSVFPTLRQSIQLEFRIQHYFIEIEVFEDHFEMIVENESTEQFTSYDKIEWSDIIKKLNEIQAQ